MNSDMRSRLLYKKKLFRMHLQVQPRIYTLPRAEHHCAGQEWNRKNRRLSHSNPRKDRYEQRLYTGLGIGPYKGIGTADVGRSQAIRQIFEG